MTDALHGKTNFHSTAMAPCRVPAMVFTPPDARPAAVSDDEPAAWGWWAAGCL